MFSLVIKLVKEPLDAGTWTLNIAKKATFVFLYSG